MYLEQVVNAVEVVLLIEEPFIYEQQRQHIILFTFEILLLGHEYVLQLHFHDLHLEFLHRFHSASARIAHLPRLRHLLAHALPCRPPAVLRVHLEQRLHPHNRLPSVLGLHLAAHTVLQRPDPLHAPSGSADPALDERPLQSLVAEHSEQGEGQRERDQVHQVHVVLVGGGVPVLSDGQDQQRREHTRLLHAGHDVD